jgi:hypothetical protein
MITVFVPVAVGGKGVLVLVAVETAGELVAVKDSPGPKGYVVLLCEQEENTRMSIIASVPAAINCFFMSCSFLISCGYLPPR